MRDERIGARRKGDLTHTHGSCSMLAQSFVSSFESSKLDRTQE